MEEAAAGGRATAVARDRPAASEHEGEHESRDLYSAGGSPWNRAWGTSDLAARRSGLDHAEGARKGPGAEVRNAIRTRDRPRALFGKPPGGGATGECRVSSAEIRSAARGGNGGGVGSSCAVNRVC